MASFCEMRDAVILEIYGGKLSDDEEIHYELVEHWLKCTYAALLPGWINTKNKGEVPASLIKPLDCVILNKPDEDCNKICGSWYQYHIDLPLPEGTDAEGNKCTEEILDLPDDKGISMVMIGQNQAERYTNVYQAKSMCRLPFASSNDKPQWGWIRAGNRIYLFGGKPIPKWVKATVWIAQGTINTIKLDDAVPMKELWAEIQKLARTNGVNMLNITTDITNDGRAA